MNIYHITHAPTAKIAHLHFWGCNLSCRACLLKKELYNCHSAERAQFAGIRPLLPQSTLHKSPDCVTTIEGLSICTDTQPLSDIPLWLVLLGFPYPEHFSPLHVGHVPWVAGLPFFMVIDFAAFMSFLDLHLTQYACTI